MSEWLVFEVKFEENDSDKSLEKNQKICVFENLKDLIFFGVSIEIIECLKT